MDFLPDPTAEPFTTKVGINATKEAFSLLVVGKAWQCDGENGRLDHLLRHNLLEDARIAVLSAAPRRRKAKHTIETAF